MRENARPNYAEHVRDDHAVLIEHANRAASFVPTIRNPFNVLAEGLVSKNSRGNRTPIELFRSPLVDWPVELKQIAMSVACLLKTA